MSEGVKTDERMSKLDRVSNNCEHSNNEERDNCFTCSNCSVHDQHMYDNRNSNGNKNCEKYNSEEGVQTSKNLVSSNGINQCHNNKRHVNENSNVAGKINNEGSNISGSNNNNNTECTSTRKKVKEQHEEEMETLLCEFVKVKEHVMRLIIEMHAHLSVLQKSTTSSSSSLLWNQTDNRASNNIWENTSSEAHKVNPFVIELHDELLKRHEAALLMLQTCANCMNVCEGKIREKAKQLQHVKEEQVELHNTKQAMTRYILGQRKREENIKTEATRTMQEEQIKYVELMESVSNAFSNHHKRHVLQQLLHRWLKQTMIRCFATQHQLHERTFLLKEIQMSTHAAIRWHERRTMERVWRYWCLQLNRRQCHRYREATEQLSHALEHVELEYSNKFTELEETNQAMQERLRAREISMQASITQLEKDKEKLQRELNEMTHEFSTRTHTYVTEQDSVQEYFTSREAALQNKLTELAHANHTLESTAKQEHTQMAHLLHCVEQYYQNVLFKMVQEHTVHECNEFNNALASVWHRWHDEFQETRAREQKLYKDVATLAPLSGKVLHLQNELSAAEHSVHVVTAQNAVLSSQLERYRSLHFTQEESHATLANDALRRTSYSYWLHYAYTKKIKLQSLQIAQMQKTLEERESEHTNKYRCAFNAHNAKMQELTDDLRVMEENHKTLIEEQKAKFTEQLLQREMQLSKAKLQLIEANKSNELLVEQNKITKEKMHKIQRECCELNERSNRAVCIMSEEHKRAALLNSHYTQWQSKCQEVESQLAELTLVCKQWEEYCQEQQTKFDLEREALTVQLANNVDRENKASRLLYSYYYKWLLHCTQINYQKEKQKELELEKEKQVTANVQGKMQDEALQLQLCEMEATHRETLHTMESKHKNEIVELTSQHESEINSLKREHEWHLLTLTKLHNTEKEKLQRTCKLLQEHTNQLAESVVEYCAKTTFVKWESWMERRKAHKRERVIRKYVQWLHESVRIREEYDITLKHNLLMEYMDKMMNNNKGLYWEEKEQLTNVCGSNTTKGHGTELDDITTVKETANVNNNCDNLHCNDTNSVVCKSEEQMLDSDLDNKECVDNVNKTQRVITKWHEKYNMYVEETMIILVEQNLMSKLETYMQAVQTVLGAASSESNITVNNADNANNDTDINDTQMECNELNINSKVDVVCHQNNDVSGDAIMDVASPCTSDVSVTVSSPVSNNSYHEDSNRGKHDHTANTVVSSVDEQPHETSVLLSYVLHENLTKLKESLLHNIIQLEQYMTQPLPRHTECHNKRSDGNDINNNEEEQKQCDKVQYDVKDNMKNNIGVNKQSINERGVISTTFDSHKWSEELTYATQLYLCIINNCVKELVQHLSHTNSVTPTTKFVANTVTAVNVDDDKTLNQEELKDQVLDNASNIIKLNERTRNTYKNSSEYNDGNMKHKSLEMTVQSLLSELAMYVNELQHVLHSKYRDNKQLESMEKSNRTEHVIDNSEVNTERRSLQTEFRNVAEEAQCKTHTATLHQEHHQSEEQQSNIIPQEHEQEQWEKQDCKRYQYKEESPRCQVKDDINGNDDELMLKMEDNDIIHSVNASTEKDNLLTMNTIKETTTSPFEHKATNASNDDKDIKISEEVKVTKDTPTKTELRRYISQLEQLLVEAKVQLAEAKSHADRITYRHSYSNNSNINDNKQDNVVHADRAKRYNEHCFYCKNDEYENANHNTNTTNHTDSSLICNNDKDHIIIYPSPGKVNTQAIAHTLSPSSSTTLTVPLSLWQSEHVHSSSSSSLLQPENCGNREKCNCDTDNSSSKKEIIETATQTTPIQKKLEEECSASLHCLTSEEEKSKHQTQEIKQREEQNEENKMETTWHELNALMNTLQHYKTMSTNDKHMLLQSCKKELNAAVSVMQVKYEEELRNAYSEIQSLLHTIDVINEQYAHDKDEWNNRTNQQIQSQQREQEEKESRIVTEHHKSMAAMKANYEDEITSLHELVNEMRNTSHTQSYEYEQQILRKREEYNRMELTNDEQLRWQLMWMAHVSLMQQYEKEAKLNEQHVKQIAHHNAAHNAQLTDIMHKCNEELESKDDYIISLSELFAIAQKWQSNSWRHRENNLWSKVECYFTCATEALKITLSHYAASINDLESRYAGLVNEMQSIHTEEKDALETELMHLQERIAAFDETTNNAKQKEQKSLSHYEELKEEQHKSEHNRERSVGDENDDEEVKLKVVENINGNRKSRVTSQNDNVTKDGSIKTDSVQNEKTTMNTTHLVFTQITEQHKNDGRRNSSKAKLDDSSKTHTDVMTRTGNNDDDMQNINASIKQEYEEEEQKEHAKEQEHVNCAENKAKEYEEQKEEEVNEKEQCKKSQHDTNKSNNSALAAKPQVFNVKESCNASSSLLSLEPLELSQRLVHFTISLSKQREMTDAVVCSTDALSDKLQALITQGAKLRNMIEQHAESLSEQEQEQKEENQ